LKRRYEQHASQDVQVDSGITSDMGNQDNEGKFHGKNISDLLFLEIFAGTARLSAAMHEVGFETLAVDKTAARAGKQHIALYDVTDPLQLKSLKDFAQEESSRIVYAHLAPACGTASRAREKRLPRLQKQGFRVPQPLRSDAKPRGLDKLSGLDKIKTELANQSYDATAEIIDLCLQLEVLISVENPANSLFWKYPEISNLCSKKGFKAIFDNCTHGGRRAKATLRGLRNGSLRPWQ